MRKFALIALASSALAVPSMAQAQDAAAETFVGVSLGYHDFDVPDEVKAEAEEFDIDLNTGGMIYGLVAGVDFPLGQSMFGGLEGNFHLGSGPIDSEYGASVRLGFRSSNNAKFYVRGGYQEIDFDPNGLVDNVDLDDEDLEGIDDSDGDFLVGVGADFGNFRVNLDTVSFDSVRATAGYVFKF